MPSFLLIFILFKKSSVCGGQYRTACSSLCSETLMFSVKHKNYALASCIKAANFVCRDADIFRKPTTVLKEILNSLTRTAQKLQTLNQQMQIIKYNQWQILNLLHILAQGWHHQGVFSIKGTSSNMLIWVCITLIVMIKILKF